MGQKNEYRCKKKLMLYVFFISLFFIFQKSYLAAEPLDASFLNWRYYPAILGAWRARLVQAYERTKQNIQNYISGLYQTRVNIGKKVNITQMVDTKQEKNKIKRSFPSFDANLQDSVILIDLSFDDGHRYKIPWSLIKQALINNLNNPVITSKNNKKLYLPREYDFYKQISEDLDKKYPNSRSAEDLEKLFFSETTQKITQNKIKKVEISSTKLFIPSKKTKKEAAVYLQPSMKFEPGEPVVELQEKNIGAYYFFPLSFIFNLSYGDRKKIITLNSGELLEIEPESISNLMHLIEQWNVMPNIDEFAEPEEIKELINQKIILKKDNKYEHGAKAYKMNDKKR